MEHVCFSLFILSFISFHKVVLFISFCMEVSYVSFHGRLSPTCHALLHSAVIFESAKYLLLLLRNHLVLYFLADVAWVAHTSVVVFVCFAYEPQVERGFVEV